MFKGFLITAGLLLCSAAVAGQRDTVISIRPVEVHGHRPLNRIGVRQTRIGQRLLKENIAMPMSDVLKFGTSLYVKEYGRASASTVSLRGTSPSHTQVMWNSMNINSPMLGMTDFSLIPAFFVDEATLLHGASSTRVAGGGLGGAVLLHTLPAAERGLDLYFNQGIGSFGTFDDFLRVGYGNDRWQVSTRALLSTSKNDYEYRNYKKKVDGRYPVERNRNGAFRDLHLLQEAYYNTPDGHRFGLAAWYLNSLREAAMLNVDYKAAADYDHELHDQTFRGVLSWDFVRPDFKIGAKAGYMHSALAYDYARDLGNGSYARMARSRNYLNTVYGLVDADYAIAERWLFTGSVALNQHFLRAGSLEADADVSRMDLSAALSAKWRPAERLGLAVQLRSELSGGAWAPVVPALFADYLVSRRGNVILKASVSQNYRFPTLNDLFFEPGGNPDLKKESGFSYDTGVEFTVGKAGVCSLHGEATWFDSRVRDWIIWLPAIEGGSSTLVYKPDNIGRVHNYGIEFQGSLDMKLAKELTLDLGGSFSWTPSINEGAPRGEYDRSVGKQLVYIPEHSSSVTGRLAWRTWSFDYKWCWYSERYATSDNMKGVSLTRIPPYYMSDIALEKRFVTRWAELSLRGAVKNLFDEEYESVLGRPMPGINFEIFIGIKPKWKK